jgi:glutathione S-transferase
MTFDLYYTPTSSGAASFISASLAGLDFTPHEVDIQSKKIKATGADYLKVNPKGNVPTLVLEDGTILNENVSSLYYINQHAKTPVGPTEGPDTYKLLTALGFVNSELHTGVGSLFNPANQTEQGKANATAKINKFVTHLLGGCQRKYVVGDSLTVVDIYAYIVLSWTAYLGLDLPEAASTYFEHIKSLPEIAAQHDRMAKLSPQ